MLRTYKAVLRGDRLEWSETPPTTAASAQPVAVHVTILGEAESAHGPSVGRKMAETLEKLAVIHALPNIKDPVEWQRSLRQERDLPGRNE